MRAAGHGLVVEPPVRAGVAGHRRMEVVLAPRGQRFVRLLSLHGGARQPPVQVARQHALPEDCLGRRPAVEGWGFEELDLDRDGPYLRIDGQCRTSMRGVFAIGDVTGEPMLAHRAMAQGEMVAEIAAGLRRSWDRRCIPAVCFTDPEIVTAGIGPEEARRNGSQIQVGQFPFSANGRAMTISSEDGFVRIVARADNHLVLGIQAVGPGVSELSAAFALAIETGARLEDIAGTIHAHPTLSEALQESALKALGHGLHT